MKKIVLPGLLSAFLLTAAAAGAQAPTAQPALTAKQAKKWFKKGNYLNGLKLKPHKSTNAQEFARQYAAHQHLWDTAFAFLKNHDLEQLPVGKYKLAGDSVFVNVTENPLKEFDKTQWEAHKKYIDLQYVAKGKEKMGVAPVATATVINPYNEAKDVANFKTEGKFYIATPGTFFLFFPQDAHRPTIKVDEPNEKKVVVKILVAQQ
ncbi:YhcH/YjgK/YiaL family protein [Paraflavisolibacter sp. H34]|uniref:YhcH/YjgK/YiaL family protein n=1 Tax=Huijunlia imazamoxiresistens TaxID=3127457 RepID=UPI0030180D1D